MCIAQVRGTDHGIRLVVVAPLQRGGPELLGAGWREGEELDANPAQHAAQRRGQHGGGDLRLRMQLRGDLRPQLDHGRRAVGCQAPDFDYAIALDPGAEPIQQHLFHRNIEVALRNSGPTSALRYPSAAPSEPERMVERRRE